VDPARLGKLFGALGSAHDGERIAALRAIDGALTASGITWAWVASVITHGERSAGEREQLFESLVQSRLAEAYAKQWTLTTSEKAVLGKVAAAVEGGAALWEVPAGDLLAAIEVGDELRRRDRPGPRRVNWR
jgi:hypothetical protein